MKTAYSLFLREHIDPRIIGYEDCRTFQIVCPVCNEPVFRVCRKGSHKEVAFFSHYRKDETLNKQCELRVSRISSDTITEINAESRNQKLRLFLRVFQDIVWANEYDDVTIKKAKRRFFQLVKSEVFASFIRGMLNQLRETVKDKNEMLDMFDESLENLAEFESPFEMSLQKEFAYDFLLHLLAGHSKANFLFLAKHAFILALAKFEDNREKGALRSWEQSILEYLHRFLRTQNEQKRQRILTEMGERQMISPYSHQDADLFVMFGSHIQYNAFGILMRIPYLHVLRAQPSLDDDDTEISSPTW